MISQFQTEIPSFFSLKENFNLIDEKFLADQFLQKMYDCISLLDKDISQNDVGNQLVDYFNSILELSKKNILPTLWKDQFVINKDIAKIYYLTKCAEEYYGIFN